MSNSSGNGSGNNENAAGHDARPREPLAVEIAKAIVHSLGIGPGSVRGVEATAWSVLQDIVRLALHEMRDCTGEEILEIVAFDDGGTAAGALFGAIGLNVEMRGPRLVRIVAAAVIARTIWNEMNCQLRGMEQRRKHRDGGRREGGGEEQRPKLAAVAGGKAS